MQTVTGGLGYLNAKQGQLDSLWFFNLFHSCAKGFFSFGKRERPCEFMLPIGPLQLTEPFV